MSIQLGQQTPEGHLVEQLCKQVLMCTVHCIDTEHNYPQDGRAHNQYCR